MQHDFLSSTAELISLRDKIFQDPISRSYLSERDIKDLIEKYGSVPRLIFNFRSREMEVWKLEEHFQPTVIVERLLGMIGRSVIDHDVAIGKFVHIVPYLLLDFSPNIIPDSADLATKPVTIAPKRKWKAAWLHLQDLKHDECMQYFDASYQRIIYCWASDYTMNLAFQTLLRMEPAYPHFWKNGSRI